MEVKQYIFQSPYANQIQIGKPDSSSIKEDEGAKENITKEAVDLSDKQIQNPVETKIDTQKNGIDVYA